MIYPGTDLKYKVTANMVGFDINEDDMTLVIKNRRGKVVYTYKAEDFFEDFDGNWYFAMKNVRTGSYYAFLTCYRGDDDFEEGSQRVVDVQHLVDVGLCPCAKKACCPPADGLTVRYERVWSVNFIDGTFLADVNGVPILDSEGCPIRFSEPSGERPETRMGMTAEEFLRLIEERDENGQIDTVPEVLDALHDIGDDTQLSVMTEQDTEDMMARILGNS